jgi:hypothetical protein
MMVFVLPCLCARLPWYMPNEEVSVTPIVWLQRLSSSIKLCIADGRHNALHAGSTD